MFGFFAVCSFFSCWIGRKPPFSDPFLLLLQLSNAPQTGKAKNAQQSGEKSTADKKGTAQRRQSHEEKGRPYFLTEVVFTLDDHWVE